MIRSLKMPVRSRERGFSLIEVLIALVILAIGLLGVAGVQLLSLQQTGNAQLRSQASMYAQNVADQVRANGGNVMSEADIGVIQEKVRRDMGGEATLTVADQDDGILVTLTWSERDPFADGGRSTETFIMRARMR